MFSAPLSDEWAEVDFSRVIVSNRLHVTDVLEKVQRHLITFVF